MYIDKNSHKEWQKAENLLVKNFAFLESTNQYVNLKTRVRVSPAAFDTMHRKLMPISGKRKVPPRMIFEDSDKSITLTAETYIPGSELIVTRHDVKYFNTWQKPTLKPINDNPKPILDHIGFLCKEDPAFGEYLLDFFAHLVQKPNERITSIPVLITRQGTGKDTIIELLEPILGPSNVRPLSNEELKSEFNGFLEQSLLCVISELNVGDKKEVAARMKQWTGGNRVQCIKKGKDAKTIVNHVNYIAFSNYDYPIYVEPDDRRYYFHRSYVERPSPEYFDKLYIWIKGDGPAIFYDYLLKRELSHFNPKSPAPMNDYKKAMIELSHSPVDALLENAYVNRMGPFAKDLVELKDLVTFCRQNDLHKCNGTDIKRFLASKAETGSIGQRSIDGRRLSLWALRRFNFYQTTKRTADLKIGITTNAQKNLKQT